MRAELFHERPPVRICPVTHEHRRTGEHERQMVLLGQEPAPDSRRIHQSQIWLPFPDLAPDHRIQPEGIFDPLKQAQRLPFRQIDLFIDVIA